MEETTPQLNEQSGTPWQKWFLLSFSLLLFVTIVLYLPLRFKTMIQSDGHDESGSGERVDHGTENMVDGEGMVPVNESSFVEESEGEESEAHDHDQEPAHHEITSQTAISKRASWWILLVSSGVLIFILSFLTRKYLKPRDSLTAKNES